MATTITLPFWPSSHDCVNWSQDNVIAVVGGESVAVLTPRLKDISSRSKHWDLVVVQVNTFTEEELSLRPLLSNAAFSVGEELAVRQAVSAKWSWPGLARHRGCVLAILTADHTLSIWTLEGKRTNNTNWKRSVIVNKAIQHYYTDLKLDQDTEDQRCRQERAQVRQRVVSFAWSQPIRKHSPQNGSNTTNCLDWGEHVLIVATDGGHILFLRVSSPYGTLSEKPQPWDIHVIGCWDTSAMTTTIISEAKGSLSIEGDRSHIVTELVIGAWRTDNQSNITADLGFISGGKFFTALVCVSKENDVVALDASAQQNGQCHWHVQERSDLRGPLLYLRTLTNPETFVMFGDNMIFHMNNGAVSNMSPLSIVGSHHLDGRWDHVSGAAFTYAHGRDASLHITSELSSATATTAALPLPFHHEKSEQWAEPWWQNTIRMSSDTYSNDHGLAGNVVVRTCGMASSPFGDLVAICSFFQPSDSIAYVIEADRTCVLNISREYETSGSFKLAPLNGTGAPISVEGIIFQIQRHLERLGLDQVLSGVNNEALKNDLQQAVLHTLLNMSVFDEESSSVRDNGDQITLNKGQLVEYTRARLHASAETHTVRASRIVDIAMTSGGNSPSVHRTIVHHLVQIILSIPTEYVRMDEYSQTIRSIFQKVLYKLDAQQKADDLEPSATGLREICRLCQQEILFESLRWARCSRGHQYPRCALSFLAIQQPRSTKSCGVCGLQYLDEATLAGFVASDDDIVMHDIPLGESESSTSITETWVEVGRNSHPSTVSQVTLAQVLFAAGDLCIHCGGKYVDER